MVVGPLLGGVLYERADYYSVFALSFAFLFTDGAFRFTFIEASGSEQMDGSRCRVRFLIPCQRR